MAQNTRLVHATPEQVWNVLADGWLYPVWVVGSMRSGPRPACRPVPGLGRAETPVRGLYLGSASAHPGGGVHGACGDNAARAAIAHDRWTRLVPGRRP